MIVIIDVGIGVVVIVVGVHHVDDGTHNIFEKKRERKGLKFCVRQIVSVRIISFYTINVSSKRMGWDVGSPVHSTVYDHITRDSLSDNLSFSTIANGSSLSKQTRQTCRSIRDSNEG